MLTDVILDLLRTNGITVATHQDGDTWHAAGVDASTGDRHTATGSDAQTAAIRLAILFGIDVEE